MPIILNQCCNWDGTNVMVPATKKDWIDGRIVLYGCNIDTYVHHEERCYFMYTVLVSISY